MSNLAYRQPNVPLVNPPRRWLLAEILGHESYVTSVAFFGDQYDRVVSGSYDEVAKLWDLNTGRCLRKFTGHTDGVTVVLAGPGGCVLTASEDRTVRMWDTETGECSKVIRSHSGAINGLCMIGPDRILTGSTDKKIRVFDASGNSVGESELVSEIMAVVSAPPPAMAAKTKKSMSSSSNKGLSSAAAALAAAEEEESKKAKKSAAPSRVRVFACGGVHIPTPAKPMLRSVEVDPAATAAAVAADGSGQRNICTAGLNEPDGEEGVVSTIAIASAGCEGSGILVTGSYDMGVRVLRNILPAGDGASAVAETLGGEGGDGVPSPAKPLLSMELLGRHSDGVRSVAVSANGRWAVSGSRDGHIKVWEILRETRPAGVAPPPALADFVAHRGVVFSMCMSPDARVLVSGGSDRYVRVWDLSLVVYARRLAVNHARALWAARRIRRARAKRASSSSSSSSPGGTGAAGRASKSFGTSREHRQHVLESLFALPEIIYAKVLMYV